MIFRWAALFAVVWAIFAGSAPTPVAAQTPALVGPCAAIYDPVCGRKKTHMITYANACLAGHDRATVLARGACPQTCSMIYKPVCGEDAQGVRRNYGNACAATADGAKIVRHRRCFVTFGRR